MRRPVTGLEAFAFDFKTASQVLELLTSCLEIGRILGLHFRYLLTSQNLFPPPSSFSRRERPAIVLEKEGEILGHF